MRKFLTATALAGGLLLANCSTLTSTNVSNVAAEVTAIFTQVEKYVSLGCAAVPEFSSIIALANAGVAVSVASLGGAFCSAFASAVPTAPPASARAPRFSRRYGGAAGGIQYYCAGTICGWK